MAGVTSHDLDTATLPLPLKSRAELMSLSDKFKQSQQATESVTTQDLQTARDIFLDQGSNIPANLFEALESAILAGREPLASMTQTELIAALNKVDEAMRQSQLNNADELTAIYEATAEGFDSNLALFVAARNPAAMNGNDAVFLSQIIATDTAAEIYALNKEQAAIQGDVVSEVMETLAEQGVNITEENKEAIENTVETVFSESAEAQACLIEHYDVSDEELESQGISRDDYNTILFEAETQAAGEHGEKYNENANKLRQLEQKQTEQSADATAAVENQEHLTLDRDLAAEKQAAEVAKLADTVYGPISPEEIELMAESAGVPADKLQAKLEEYAADGTNGVEISEPKPDEPEPAIEVAVNNTPTPQEQLDNTPSQPAPTSPGAGMMN